MKKASAQEFFRPGACKTASDADVRLLAMIKSAHGEFVSGEKLSRELGISRAAVWKRIRGLEEAGYRLEGVSHKGYRLVQSPDRILPEEFFGHLSSRRLGRRLSVLDTVDSTNRVAVEWASRGLVDGTLIVAEAQTHGRGRLGRCWIASKGKGLTYSLVLTPNCTLAEVATITLAKAVAVAGYMQRSFNIEARVRWPNDVTVGTQKICGILTEVSAQADRIDTAVLGTGINVNGIASDYGPGAVTLQELTGKCHDRNRVLAGILSAFEPWYDKVVSGKTASLLDRANALSALNGCVIELITHNHRFRGTALGIAPDGSLRVADAEGKITNFHSGDIIQCV
ncbi:MAG: biotin--[acetyl-CoA-carboxylase] ligase [Candidatus Omnitrophica bacterium]|nr:biotin--[acetyl-CoA-carboxylase] ligase [Candidatus Omnitrophota bacterium]